MNNVPSEGEGRVGNTPEDPSQAGRRQSQPVLKHMLACIAIPRRGSI